jgi:hypothetical protein
MPSDFSMSAFQLFSFWIRPLTSDLSISSSLRDDEMWALRDISFEVKQGEILGIIRRNRVAPPASRYLTATQETGTLKL